MQFTVIEEEKRCKPFEGVKIYDKARLHHVETEVKNALPSSQGILAVLLCFVLALSYWLNILYMQNCGTSLWPANYENCQRIAELC